jgi:hypothetical protein
MKLVLKGGLSPDLSELGLRVRVLQVLQEDSVKSTKYVQWR